MAALTYDDVPLVPSYNHWESRKVVDISNRCKTGKLSLALPVMTANMDTVTESAMANFIGSKGGIGVLHRFLPIDENIVKALAFGADFVMLGGMLAGTRPTPGSVNTIKKPDGRTARVKTYRGSASRNVQDANYGGQEEWRTSEGITLEVPYREDEDKIIADIIGGLRSGLTYGGAATIRELQRKLDYITVTRAGRTESLPHKSL